MTDRAFFGTVLPAPPPDRAAAETGAAILRDQGLAAEVTPEGQLRVRDGRGAVVLLRVAGDPSTRPRGFVARVWRILDGEVGDG